MNKIDKTAIVCGSGFGKIYLEAISKMDDYKLVGVLGRGDRSKIIAKEYNVPFYDNDDIDNINVDLACVIIPNSNSGGNGWEIAKKFLNKGIPTLLEHPAHPSEILECIAVAKNTPFILNPFYRYTKVFRKFLEYIQIIKSNSKLLNAYLECSINVLYDGLDMLGKSIGILSNWELGKPSMPLNDIGNHNCGNGNVLLNAVIGEVPVSLKVNKQIDINQPDHPMHLYHRIELTFDTGRICLVNTNGPIVWMPFLEIARDKSEIFDFKSIEELEIDIPTALSLDFSKAGTIRETLTDTWVDAAQVAVNQLFKQSHEEKLRQAQFQILISTLWSEVCKLINYTELIEYKNCTSVAEAHKNVYNHYIKSKN